MDHINKMREKRFHLYLLKEYIREKFITFLNGINALSLIVLVLLISIALQQ